MELKEVLQPGDIVEDIKTHVFYEVKSIHPDRDEIRVVRLNPRKDKRRTRPYHLMSGHYKPCKRFREAVCPEIKEESKCQT